jgi:hypothetical protein
MSQKLIDQLERDMRNQALIDSLLRLNRRQKMAAHFQRYNYILIVALLLVGLAWVFVGLFLTKAFAEELPPPTRLICPTAGETCKILVITASEENVLMRQNGILDTAAQGRSLELGQAAVYFKTRIQAAPQGEVMAPAQPGPKPPASHENPPEVPAK